MCVTGCYACPVVAGMREAGEVCGMRLVGSGGGWKKKEFVVKDVTTFEQNGGPKQSSALVVGSNWRAPQRPTLRQAGAPTPPG